MVQDEVKLQFPGIAFCAFGGNALALLMAALARVRLSAQELKI